MAKTSYERAAAAAGRVVAQSRAGLAPDFRGASDAIDAASRQSGDDLARAEARLEGAMGRFDAQAARADTAFDALARGMEDISGSVDDDEVEAVLRAAQRDALDFPVPPTTPISSTKPVASPSNPIARDDRAKPPAEPIYDPIAPMSSKEAEAYLSSWKEPVAAAPAPARHDPIAPMSSKEAEAYLSSWKEPVAAAPAPAREAPAAQETGMWKMIQNFFSAISKAISNMLGLENQSDSPKPTQAQPLERLNVLARGAEHDQTQFKAGQAARDAHLAERAAALGIPMHKDGVSTPKPASGAAAPDGSPASSLGAVDKSAER